MFKKGLCSVTFRDLSPIDIIELAQKAQLDGIEWGADVHVPPNDLAYACQVAEKTVQAGLEVSSYGSYYRVGCDNIQPFEDVLQTAIALKAPSIRVWAGNTGSNQITQNDYAKVIHDTRRIAFLAEDNGIQIDFEFHCGTLTDTRDSAVRLMNDIHHENIRLYWQPAVGESVPSRIKDIESVQKWLSHIHVFHWACKDRLPLTDGKKEWRQYMECLSKCPGDHYAMLEFVKNDDQQVFLSDAKTLHRLITH